MPLITADSAPLFHLHGATFQGLAAPSRGATDNAVWRVTLHPGAAGMPHRLTREETFVALEGRALATIDDESVELEAGAALVVPAQARFTLANPHELPFHAVAVLPVGGMAVIDQGFPFTPPWAA